MATRQISAFLGSFARFSSQFGSSAFHRRRCGRGLAALAVLLAAGLIGISAGRATAAPAAPAAEPPADGAAPRKAFEGKVNADTLVFSGPGTHTYPTMRLPAGSTVIAVGINPREDWLKIMPPQGSFSYVSRADVNRYGDASHGKVSKQTNVRAGSALVQSKLTMQTKLEPDADVTILGEEAEYLKIKPPAGAYVWIASDAVTYIGPYGVRPEPTLAQNGGAKTTPPGPVGPIDVGPGIPTVPAPTTQGAIAIAPTTQPNAAELLTQLQKLEADFAEMSKLPLVDQPVPDLRAQYEKLAAAPGLPEMAKRIADVRVATLNVRAETKDQFLDVQKQQRELAERLKEKRVEKDEIEQRIKEIDITVYAAVGTLRTSSLQVAKTPLYRLTDPQTGRTVVYIWGTDPKIGDLMNQFVGVKAPMQTDPRLNLKVVTPTTTEAVDPAKVNTSVAAEIVPPSLMPKAPIANTGNQ